MPDNRTSNPAAFKRTTLAAAIALTFATPAVFAAPSANQLPGNGKVSSGSTKPKVANPSTGTETLTLQANSTDKDTIINWGVASSNNPNINTNQPGGFNIGASATLNFSASSISAVLNIDKSGNPSQIMGKLNSTGSPKSVAIYVANGNGIMVGSNAVIKSKAQIGLIGESGKSLKTSSFIGGSAPYHSIKFNGTSGGNVTVNKGATITGSKVLVAGGSNVNIGNLSNLNGTNQVKVTAGLPLNTGTFASKNKNAVLTVSGKSPGGVVGTTIKTAGNLVTTGTSSNPTDLATNASKTKLSVGDTLINKGTLDLQDPNQMSTHSGNKLTFKVVNNGTLNVALTGTSSPHKNMTINGDVTNNGLLRIDGQNQTSKIYNFLKVTGGNLTNNGNINGKYDLNGKGPYTGLNNPTFSASVKVINGSIVNNTSMKKIWKLTTTSNSNAKKGADYSIKNVGTISKLQGSIAVNTSAHNSTTGAFTNIGELSVPSGFLVVTANNDLKLGGQVDVGGKTNSASNPLASLSLTSNKGKVTLSAPVVTNTDALVGNDLLSGQQVAVMSNLTDTGTQNLIIKAGADLASKSKYAVRVAKGKTVTSKSGEVDVFGLSNNSGGYTHPNVILQGQLSGNTINLGGTDTTNGAVSDVFSGPKGGLIATGSSPTVNINFTGRIKTAPYTNDSSNFRYNDLPITSKNPVNLNLDPVKYQTNGTTNVSSSGSKSAVNILVNNSVTVQDKVNGGTTPSSVPSAGQSAVTGVHNWPNTHLVLQSTGNITAAKGSNNGFYWPGLVYMGTIKTVNGQPAPGTLSNFGTITATGNLNNVLPGSTNKGGGMHLMTAQPVAVSGKVVTNAKSWVNFPNDKLTNHYANNNASLMKFYGGSVTNTIVNYNLLPKSDFHTQAVVTKK